MEAPDPNRTGIPEVDALIEAKQLEQGRFDEAAVISLAEGTVADARQADLAAQQQAARRRQSAARGLLTKAQKNGGAAVIAAARERLDRAEDEFDRISDEVIHELQQLTRARLDSLGQALDQMNRTNEAGAAVLDALAGRRGSGQPERGTAP